MSDAAARIIAARKQLEELLQSVRDIPPVSRPNCPEGDHDRLDPIAERERRSDYGGSMVTAKDCP